MPYLHKSAVMGDSCLAPWVNSLHTQPELVVLVDFKAIYPWVPPGISVSFPGVAHFLSFEQICKYPRVPQGKVVNSPVTLGSYFPWLEPGEIKIPGVLFHNIIQILNSYFKF